MYKTYGKPLPGKHPSEAAEMATFFSQLPDNLKRIALHIRNEGSMSHAQVMKLKIGGGYIKGASDIIIPGNPTFVCEMKSLSKTSRVAREQKEYLNAAADNGAFAVLAYGYKSALEAVKDWENGKEK